MAATSCLPPYLLRKENGGFQKPPFFGAMPVCGIAIPRQTYGFFLFRLCGG